MKRLKLASYIIIGVIVFISLVFIIVATLKPKVAGIYVDTNHESDVSINGKVVGRTPYRGKARPGEAVIKLVPVTYGITLLPYETKVRLTVGVETVIRYDFGETDETSAGEVISFEKVGGSQTSLVAVTVPDSTELIIDGGPKSYTPHKTSTITPGEHILTFKIAGYKDREVRVKTFENYKLTAIVRLAKDSADVLSVVNTSAPSPTPTLDPKIEVVEILGNDIGYLRVRKEASSESDEIGRVEPGKRYRLIETDLATGWYKIEFDKPDSGAGKGKEGWISDEYARIVNPKATPTPTRRPLTATPSATTPTP